LIHSINLDEPTALVLFEVLARWNHDDKPLAIHDPSEEYALLQLVAALEKALMAPLDPQYGRLLEQAREELRRRMGVA
jgi:hypothetical protein